MNNRKRTCIKAFDRLIKEDWIIECVIYDPKLYDVFDGMIHDADDIIPYDYVLLRESEYRIAREKYGDGIEEWTY